MAGAGPSAPKDLALLPPVVDHQQGDGHHRVELTPEQEEAELQRLVSPLASAGVNLALFSMPELSRRGFTLPMFSKMFEVICSARDTDALHKLFETGIRCQRIGLPNVATLDALIAFAKWARSPDGQAAISDTERRDKIAKREDYERAVKITRARFDDQIAELKRQVRVLEEAKTRAIEKLRYHN